MPVTDLPKHARIGLDSHVWNRATVEPDGTITLSVDQIVVHGGTAANYDARELFSVSNRLYLGVNTA